MNLIIEPVTRCISAYTRHKEKKLGYGVSFKQLPEGWLQSVASYPMDKIWRRYGIRASGINYFTIGAIQNGRSTRFDPASPLFQSWLGCYLITFDSERKWELDDHFKLAVADQKNWLKIYGNSKPSVQLASAATTTVGPIQIGNYSGTLYCGDISSDIDVGGSLSAMQRPRIAGLAGLFNNSGSVVNVTPRNLEPDAQSKSIQPFQNILLRGYIAIIDVSPSVKVVMYANAAVYKTAHDVIHDNYKKIGPDLLQAMKRIEIHK